jgi:poly(3-hydroxybutyrate) depolymerase/photosystem II stability/assembly factor-like uncharacterized protein
VGSSSSAGGGGGAGPEQCTDACADGEARCGPNGAERCEVFADGCRDWSAPEACAAGSYCDAGDCVVCSGDVGTFSNQTLDVDGETRHYFLHVPSSYACPDAAPLLVDFHGTAGGAPDDNVEEYYALDGLLDVAEKEGFIVVRPRSLSDNSVFQWDVHPGDLERNGAFAHALVEALRRRYHIDAERTYAAGFSNGTNMAVQFLADDPPVFSGYGLIGGGVWTKPVVAPGLADAPPRFWETTGYRDYMHQYQKGLASLLDQYGLAGEHVRVRETDTGHDLYGWHYAELWPWLDRGEAPTSAGPKLPWSAEVIVPNASLLQIARADAGAIVVGSADGSLWRRDAASVAWSQVATVTAIDGSKAALTALCLLPSGDGIAVGEGAVVLTSDHGATWTKAPAVPEFGTTMWFGYSYLTAMDCTPSGRFIGGGYWSAVQSDTLGATWAAASAIGSYGFPAQLASIRTSTDGTSVAVGYWNYVGRSEDGATFEPVDVPTQREWYTDIAVAEGGRFWIVGEAGTILASTDAGKSWAVQASGTNEDLYAVDFFDALHGAAVGAHGVVVATTDGGATWKDASTGLDEFLGDVVWLDEATLLAVGGNGTAVRAPISAF